MQVIMSMEEYENLRFNVDKKIAEVKEKHQADLLCLGNKYKTELNKLREDNKILKKIILEETGKEVL